MRYAWDVDGVKRPVISRADLLKMEGQSVAGMLPIGIWGGATVRNGRFKVDSHKVPSNFDDFCPCWTDIDGVRYVVEG